MRTTTASGQLRVMLVSPSDNEREWMRAAFQNEPIGAAAIVECENIEKALAAAERTAFDVVLIDTSIEDLARLSTSLQSAAIFFIAGQDSDISPDAALAAGAADFLVPSNGGFDALELQQAMRQGLRFHKINRERSYFAEILKERDRQISQLTMLVNRGQVVDSRTGWPKHEQIVSRLGEELKRASRYSLPLTLLLMELEGLSSLLSAHGGEFADHVIRELADRIRSVARKTDVCGHFGPDSFIVLLTNTEREGALIFCHRALNAIEAPIEHNNRTASVRCWFGLSEYGPDSQTTEEHMLGIAAERLERARQQGIHGVVLAD